MPFGSEAEDGHRSREPAIAYTQAGRTLLASTTYLDLNLRGSRVRRSVLVGLSILLALGLISTPGAGGTAWSSPLRPPADTSSLLPPGESGAGLAAVTELTPAFPPFGTPGYTQWMGASGSAREYLSMSKQSLNGPTLRVSYSYEYNGNSRQMLCGSVSCFYRPHGPQPIPTYQLGGEWAFLGNSAAVSDYGKGDWHDAFLTDSSATRYRLRVPSGSVMESVATQVTRRSAAFADVRVRIVRTGTLTFKLPAITTKEKLYFGLNNHPSQALSIMRGKSPYRNGFIESAAWWTSGNLRSPTSDAPSGPFPSAVPPSDGPAPAPAIGYAALGDSYSSGEGLRPFLSGTNTGKNTCHRSLKAYSQLIRPKPDAFVACSGQTSMAYFYSVMSGKEKEKPQKAALNKKAGLVTMTMGGNNLDWSGILPTCIQVQTQVVHVVVLQDAKRCQSSLNQIPGRLTSMRSSLMAIYSDALMRAPNAQIRVLNYPPLFPDRGNNKGKDCRILRLNVATPLSPTGFQLSIKGAVEQKFVQVQDQANFAVAQAVNWTRTYNAGGSRLQLVDVTGNFGGARGHTSSCGDTDRPTPWINSMKLEAEEVNEITRDILSLDFGGVMKDVSKNFYSGSYHPTEEGQHQMYLALAPSLPSRWR